MAQHNSVNPISSSASSSAKKLTVREAASFLRLSKSFLDKRRLDGTGPDYLQFGRRIVYDIHDLEVWASANRKQQSGGVA